MQKNIPRFLFTSDSSTEGALLHQGEYKLCLAGAGASPDDHPSVGGEMRGEMCLDLSLEPLASNKATTGLTAAGNLEV